MSVELNRILQGVFPRGLDLLHNHHLNKGTAFTQREREAFGLIGLLPCKVLTLEEQAQRVWGNYLLKPTDLEKYIYLRTLATRNETLFYYVVEKHIEEMLPILYTPTVGLACQRYSNIYQRPSGVYLSELNRGYYRRILRNWDTQDVRVIVITDGERILGLGDLGANGMGIPEGKLTLYTACAGVHPRQCLPVLFDVGTDNQELLKNPLYSGRNHPRIRGEAYDELLDEFVDAVQTVFPHALIQFEDFANQNAFRLLRKYRHWVCTFNDDIQGTAAVALAGVYSALRITDRPLRDQRFLFLGAGEAGIGIGELIVSAMMHEGVSETEARRSCWFIDSKGLVVAGRGPLAEHKQAFAHQHPGASGLMEAIEALQPTALIGVSGIPRTFTQEAITLMSRLQERPIIFALSNPTSKAECTAEEAYGWSQGRAIFASGSPFDPVEYQGKTLVPGQGNNAYIFPGVGMGVLASKSSRVTDEMFFRAAQTLAGLVTPKDLDLGRIYPSLKRIHEVSFEIALETARVAYERGLARHDLTQDLGDLITSQIYRPVYPEYA